MPTSNNVFHFPSNTELPFTPPKSIDEIKENIELIRQVHVQETLEAIIPMLFSQLTLAGFPIDGEEIPSYKEGAFISETIRAILLKIYNIHHPIQNVIEHIFEETDDGLKIIDELNVWLKEESPVDEEELD
jgi:hypothetical protein